MRIAILSNPPDLHYGYSVLSKNLLLRLRDAGHEMALIDNCGGIASMYDWMGIPIYPTGSSRYPEKLFFQHAKDFNADIILSIFDMFVLSEFHEIMRDNHEIQWVAYSPVDTEHIIPRYVDVLKGAYRIIPMSKHGESELKEKLPDNTVDEIPGGVDTKVFKPLWDSLKEKSEWKEKLGLSPDNFLVFWAGDSRGVRKSVAENLEGFKIFAENNKKLNPILLVHSRIFAQDPTSFDIQYQCDALGITDIVKSTDQYSFDKGGATEQELAEMYNAADIYLHCSRGEGLGLMPLEANACGTPVVFTNATSMPEYSVGAGVEPHIWCMEQHNVRKAIPHPKDIAAALENLAESAPSIQDRDRCVKHAEKYDWDIIIKKHWLPFLEKLEKDIDKDCMRVPKYANPMREIKIYGERGYMKEGVIVKEP